MKAELIDISATKKNLDIEIPQDVVDHEVLHIAREFAKRAKVPGFRPGKAPIQVVKTRYKDEILSEMFQHLLPKYFGDAVQERKLDIVHTPRFEEVNYNNGEPLRFKAVFEVYPQFEVTNYVGVPVEQVEARVEEAEILDSLKRLQEQMAEMVPVDEERPIREGDFADISFQGKMQGSDEELPISADQATVEVGAATTLKEFTDNLIGAKAGEERTFGVTYREDYPEKRLANKTIEYQVKVDSIKEKKVPELNDDFAQGLGEYQTLDELKAKVHSDIEKHKSEHANDQMREKLLEWLEENNEFEIPDTLAERQLAVRLQRLLRDLGRQGVNPQGLDVDWAKIRDDQRTQSIRDVRGSLILEYIADKEKIDVADEDIDAEIETIANETQQPRERVREVLTRDTGLDRLKGQIRNRKTLDFLHSQAKIQPAAAGNP